MPRISEFYGIVITMYYREHGIPHFHAIYGADEATVAIASAELIAGSLPDRVLRMVLEWRRRIALSSRPTGNLRAAPSLCGGSRHCPSIGPVSTLVHVTSIEAIAPHRLMLTFEDGTAGEIDASGWDWEGVFAPLQDPAYFGRVRLDEELGTAVWPNGADIAPETLHAWVVSGLGRNADSSPETAGGNGDERPADPGRAGHRTAAEIGVDAGAGVAGVAAALGATAVVGPAGVLVGPAVSATVRRFLKWRGVEHAFDSAAEELARRRLTQRELARAQTAYEHAIKGIANRLERGEALRNDGFFDRPRTWDGHRPAEEVLDGLLSAASQTHEQRKAERLGELFAFLAFQPDITPGHAIHLLALAEQLTYEQLLLLGAFESGDAALPDWTPTGAFTRRETGLVMAILDLARADLIARRDHQPIASFADINPALLKTALNGAILVEAMDLTQAEPEDWAALKDVFRRLGTIDANEPSTRLDAIVPPGADPAVRRVKIDKQVVRFSAPGVSLADLPGEGDAD